MSGRPPVVALKSLKISSLWGLKLPQEFILRLNKSTFVENEEDQSTTYPLYLLYTWGNVFYSEISVIPVERS